MCNGQMAGRQNTHSKWRTVFHTTQTKSKQQSCCKQKQNNISHQHSRQRKFTGKEAGKRTRMKERLIPPLWVDHFFRQTALTLTLTCLTIDKMFASVGKVFSFFFRQTFALFKVMKCCYRTEGPPFIYLFLRGGGEPYAKNRNLCCRSVQRPVCNLINSLFPEKYRSVSWYR